MHVVWSRIDLETLKAIPDSHNYRRHELVARELERAFGHAKVKGAHIDRAGERPDRTPSHAEMQQAERSGLDPAAAKAQLTEIWNRTDSGKAFAVAIEEQGWILARGDRRDFVVVDQAGEVHSLARRVEGTCAKDIRTRMSDVDAASLPSVDQARENQLAREKERPEATPGERDTDKPLAPAVTTSSGGMVAQQLEALWRFERNSAQMSLDRVARAEILRRAERSGEEKRPPEIDPKQRDLGRDDKSDISR